MTAKTDNAKTEKAMRRRRKGTAQTRTLPCGCVQEDGGALSFCFKHREGGPQP